jgi:hypothetical protein
MHSVGGADRFGLKADEWLGSLGIAELRHGDPAKSCGRRVGEQRDWLQHVEGIARDLGALCGCDQTNRSESRQTCHSRSDRDLNQYVSVTSKHLVISRTNRAARERYEDDGRIEIADTDLYRQMDPKNLVFFE